MKFLTPAQIQTIEQEQARLQHQWKTRDSTGESITYLGKEFIVLPNVFPPRSDSIGVVQNLPDLHGKSLLDVGTGSGVIAIFAALKGAAEVVAIDINPDSVACATANVQRHNMADIVTVYHSDLFDAISLSKQFDLITANLPFRNKIAPDVVAASQWDTDFATHRRFFAEVRRYLQPNGCILMPHGNYPELEQVLSLAEQSDFRVEEITRKQKNMHSPQVYITYKMLLHS